MYYVGGKFQSILVMLAESRKNDKYLMLNKPAQLYKKQTFFSKNDKDVKMKKAQKQDNIQNERIFGILNISVLFSSLHFHHFLKVFLVHINVMKMPQ